MRSPLFLLIAVSLITLLHLFVGWQLIPMLMLSEVGQWLAWAMVAAGSVLMPLGLLAPAIRYQSWSDRVAWIGLTSMGLFSSLLVLTLLRLVALGAAGWLAWPVSQPVLSYSAWLVVGLSVAMSVIGWVNARRRAAVIDVDIPLPNLPLALHGFTIAQITDIHVGPTIKHGYLSRIVSAVNHLEADLIAITGDLVDGRVPQLAKHTQPLAWLRAKHGVYFVTGNHEYYSGAHAWIDELKRLGLTVLMNEHVVIDHQGAALVVAGVTDYTAHHFDPSHRSDPHQAVAGAPIGAIKLLLAHQPRTAAVAAAAGFDLQLSGHTHGGQFFPWNWFVPLQQPFTAGLHRIGQLLIYISRGTGYWGPPKRFGAPSEITRLRLVPMAGTSKA
ncbi:hypothetical protein HNQ59_000471 [Chitinivorax tropicus]|uniref:Calcineurin-like phosphoesterase domain-containing protein n=1 Tax=Chitinivorax tropicus TaxID=714531 RepID=A0A840MJ46_9PROT|nr:metallophosphoesterase [Chitinivorax tropicus]MBB5017209.1 hypothetical protein [Chitinivorax tropicus]